MCSDNGATVALRLVSAAHFAQTRLASGPRGSIAYLARRRQVQPSSAGPAIVAAVT